MVLGKRVVLGMAVAVTAMMMMMSGCGKQTKQMAQVTDFHDPVFGENTFIFTPQDNPAKVQETLDALYKKQEGNQFGKDRYSVYFMPGQYDEKINVNVGFYTQVAGMGISPEDTKIPALTCTARWLSTDPTNHNAT